MMSQRYRQSVFTSLRRAMTPVILFAVLLGGVFPALYEDALPHEHIFVGGPPPADWENHPHPNPLLILFAPKAPSELTTDGANQFGKTGPNHVKATRVVSLYSGSVLLVLSVVALDVVVPAASALPAPRPLRQIIFASPIMIPQACPGPPSPPPR